MLSPLTVFVVTYFCVLLRACVVSLHFFMVTCIVYFSVHVCMCACVRVCVCVCVCVCVNSSTCHDMFVHSLRTRIRVAHIAPLSITHAGTPLPPLTLAFASTQSSSPLLNRPRLYPLTLCLHPTPTGIPMQSVFRFHLLHLSTSLIHDTR